MDETKIEQYALYSLFSNTYQILQNRRYEFRSMLRWVNSHFFIQVVRRRSELNLTLRNEVG